MSDIQNLNYSAAAICDWITKCNRQSAFHKQPSKISIRHYHATGELEMKILLRIAAQTSNLKYMLNASSDPLSILEV